MPTKAEIEQNIIKALKKAGIYTSLSWVIARRALRNWTEEDTRLYGTLGKEQFEELNNGIGWNPSDIYL